MTAIYRISLVFLENSCAANVINDETGKTVTSPTFTYVDYPDGPKHPGKDEAIADLFDWMKDNTPD